MIVATAAQRVIQKKQTQLASAVIVVASVGVKKMLGGYLASTTHVPHSPVVQAALVSPAHQHLSIVLATGWHGVNPVDVGPDRGMNLGEKSDNKLPAHMETQTVYVNLEDSTTNTTLQSSLFGGYHDTSPQGPPVGDSGSLDLSAPVKIILSPNSIIRQCLKSVSDEIIFYPQQEQPTTFLSAVLKLGFDHEMIDKVLRDGLRWHDKTGPFKMNVEHVAGTRLGFIVAFQVGNTTMSLLGFAPDSQGILQTALLGRPRGMANIGPLKDKLRAMVYDINPVLPLGDYDMSSMTISAMVDDLGEHDWKLTTHTRKVVSFEGRHPRGNTFVLTRVKRSPRPAKANDQVPSYVALQKYGDADAGSPSDEPIFHPSARPMMVPPRLVGGAAPESLPEPKEEAIEGAVIKAIGPVRHEKNKLTWANKIVRHDQETLGEIATRYEAMKKADDAKSKTKIAVPEHSVGHGDVTAATESQVETRLVERALQSLNDQRMALPGYGTGVDDFLFSGDDIEATVDRLRQRDARRAKGKKAKAIKEVEAVKEVKQSKVREQAKKDVQDIKIDDGEPPKYMPLRATGAHRDQIRAREMAAAQASSVPAPASRSSPTLIPVVIGGAPETRPRRSCDDLSPAVAARLRAMAAEESSLSARPRDQVRARQATAAQILSRPPSAAKSNSNLSSPSQTARSQSSEASVDEVLSDLVGSGWRNVTRSEIIGLKHEGQSDIGSAGSFVQQSRKKSKGKGGGKGKATASAGVAVAVMGSAPVTAPSSTCGSSAPSTPSKMQDKGKGGAATPPRKAVTGSGHPRTANNQPFPSNIVQRRGLATIANTAFHIGHPGLATVARTMTTGTLDAIPPVSSDMAAALVVPETPIPTEWAEEHYIVEELMRNAGRGDLVLASRHDSGLVYENPDAVTDARHADEFYPGASDYNFDIDDYCISRGGFDASEAERIALEIFHQQRLEEDRINLEQRAQARFAMELMQERAMKERRRLDKVKADEEARARVNPFDSVLEEWTNTQWPDEQLRQ